MAQNNAKVQAVLARRKAAAAQAQQGGRVPTNAPAKVEPARARPAASANLSARRTSTQVADPDDDEDDGDDVAPEPVKTRPAFRKVPAQGSTPTKTSTGGGQDARKAARALTVLNSQTPGALAPRGLVVPDLTRQITEADLVLPRLKISQAMSKVNTDDIVRQGNFYRSPQNKNLGKELYVILADMRKSRSYFERGSGVLCRSFDMIQGEGDPGILCEGSNAERAQGIPAGERGCALRLWGERDENGRSSPPACGEAYNYLLLILNKDDMFEGPTMQAMWSLRSTAIKMGREINTIISDYDGVWSDVVLKLTISQAQSGGNQYFVPSVEFFGTSAGTAKKKAQKLSERMLGTSIRGTMEAEAED